MLFVLISLFQFKLSVGTCASCLGCWMRPFLFAMPFSTQRSNPTLEMIGKIFEIAWSRNFKIELGLELVYYTICQDWEVVISGDGGHYETLKKSWWTRQAQLSPFNFKKVFVKKSTNGINHANIVFQSPGNDRKGEDGLILKWKTKFRSWWKMENRWRVTTVKFIIHTNQLKWFSCLPYNGEMQREKVEMLISLKRAVHLCWIKCHFPQIPI